MGFPRGCVDPGHADGEDLRVDIRSSSRYFESDLGSNAARISRLIDDLNSAVENGNLRPAEKLPVPIKPPGKTVEEVSSEGGMARPSSFRRAAWREPESILAIVVYGFRVSNVVRRPGMTGRGFVRRGRR